MVYLGIETVFPSVATDGKDGHGLKPGGRGGGTAIYGLYRYMPL